MMTKNTLREYCLSRKAAAEDTPFGEDTLVFRVMGKIFGLMGIDTPDDQPARINLKCDPNLAIILRQIYPTVLPGYHMNKTHWNTIVCDGTIPDDEILTMIDDSYDLIVASLTKKQRDLLDMH